MAPRGPRRPADRLGAALPRLDAVAGELGAVAAPADLTDPDAAARVVAAARELRRSRVRLVDVRPPHTETGLAARSIAGRARALPPGLEPDAVADRILAAIEAGERDVPAAAFG